MDLALRRAQADRAQADAQLRLLLAGPGRGHPAGRGAGPAANSDLAAAQADLASAESDFQRFDGLLKSNSGSQKQRDDAATRRDVAREHVAGAQQRIRAAAEVLARIEGRGEARGDRRARARVMATDAQIATLEQNRSDATVKAPVAGLVTEKLVDVGELLAPRTPIVVVADLDHAWANIYLDEPLVPRIRLGQPATILTDAGGRIEGTVTFISAKAEFTPRNVQTAEERSKLVYRIKISVDNRQGVLKQGMPVEADIPLK